MGVDVWVEAVGRPATDRLASLIHDRKAGDPLAPVLVVVPGSYTGLAARRRLGGRGTGLVNVTFTTLERLAAQLGAPRLEATGRRPITGAVRAAAAREALRRAPGVFAEVATHPATAATIAAASTELRTTRPATLAALAAQSDRAADVVRLVGDVRRRTAGWYDEADLAEAAVEAVRSGAVEVVPTIVHLPDRLDAVAIDLVEALGRHTSVDLVLGRTGDGDADAAITRLAERFGGAAAPPPTTIATPTAAEVVSAPSADTEVLAALRILLDRHAAGVPLHRLALAYAAREPYARLVRDAVRAAGLPHNGPAVRTLAQTIAGRVLLGLLRLPTTGWRRDAVLAWMASGPVLDGGRPVPVTAWGRLSELAGIVGGAPQWTTRLDAFARRLDQEAATQAERAEGPEWRVERARGDAARARALARFVAELVDRLDPQPAPTTWAGWATWADLLLVRSLGDRSAQAAWTADELDALDSVRSAVAGLAVLDDLEPAPDLDGFVRALAAELDVRAQQTGRFGVGLLLCPVAALGGLDLDTAVVVGMNEGSYPPRAREDGLLPDAERRAAGPDLPLASNRLADDRRAFLAALASADRTVLTHARADQRRGRDLLPSRWLLESASHLAGHRIEATDLERTSGVPGIRLLASHTAAVRADGEPVSPLDHDLRLLLRHVEAGGDPAAGVAALDQPRLADGFAALAARAGAELTPWDGRVGRGEVSAVTGTVTSPTSLETYAACPFRYLLSRVLRVEVPERPEEVVTISAADRGSLMHEVFEAFIDERVRSGGLPRPDEPWSAGDRARLLEITDEVCARYQHEGRTGVPVLWRFERIGIERDLVAFLEEDSRRRAARRLVPARAELAFGFDGAPPVEVELPHGRRVTFRGRIDRVDRADDGRLVVTDYKTGSAKPYRSLDGDDPVVRGTKLQLGVYALAARQALSADEVHSEYWFTSTKGGFTSLGYDVDERVEGALVDALDVLVDGIEQGLFPARPGPKSESCTFCDYEDLCGTTRERHRRWERKRTAPELARLVALVDPPDGEEPDGEEPDGDDPDDDRGTSHRDLGADSAEQGGGDDEQGGWRR